ncbi:MAG: RNHCP domain-containing protein [Candidatus Daviesbacteria bacterium]|nr:RNHCP domain-containing protein [Candidatus Daviesbacteria bacterium]
MKNYQIQDFKCLNCGKEVSSDNLIGTLNKPISLEFETLVKCFEPKVKYFGHRNHCPFCLYSKHVDLDISGDRKAECHNLMEPIGLTFKKEGFDKYGKEKQGEIMIIHFCPKDQKISINRIAGDDDPKIILKVFKNYQNLDLEIKDELEKARIRLLSDVDENEIQKQLYGRN